MARRGSAFSIDRLLAVSFVFMVTVALAGVVSKDTGASFTGGSANPSNHMQSLLVQPPATQNNTTSAAAGVIDLSWTASPTAPGTGHTLSYLVFRGPVGGPYSQIGSSTVLTYSDTPTADGTYEYIIQTQIAGGGTFTSGGSVAQTGISDRVAPTKSITCNGGACSATAWYTAAVSVTVSGTDGGTGMGSVTRNVDAGGQVSTGGSSATFNVSGDSASHSIVYFTTDAAGNSSANGTQTIKIDATAPTAASGLTSATGANGSPVTLDLSWTAGTDVTSGVQGYEVRWTNSGVTTCPSQNTTNFPNSATIGAVTSYQVSGLVNNTNYCAYLVTIDNAGNRSANSATTGPTKAK